MGRNGKVDRKNFLKSLVGLVLAPALIEKLIKEEDVWAWKKGNGTYARESQWLVNFDDNNNCMVNQKNFQALFRPGIRKAFEDSYAEYPEEYPFDIFKT